MPSTRKKETKDGRIFYEIIVRRGRNKSALTSRWYVPEGWSQRAIDRELTTVAADFERRCNDGEVISRQEQKNKAVQEAQEAAKVLTLHQYGETVFMPTKAVTISENTRSNFQGYLDRSIYPALGDLKMPDITPANISALLLSIQADGKSHATVIKCYTILHTLFKMAYMADAIPRNPMDKVERPKPRKDETQTAVESCSIDELRHILQCLQQEPLKWQALVRLLMDQASGAASAAGSNGRTLISSLTP